MSGVVGAAGGWAGPERGKVNGVGAGSSPTTAGVVVSGLGAGGAAGICGLGGKFLGSYWPATVPPFPARSRASRATAVLDATFEAGVGQSGPVAMKDTPLSPTPGAAGGDGFFVPLSAM